MSIRKPLRRRSAFSLVEVVLAIGVVAFAVLSVFGLLSTATDTNKRSRDEQAAAQIAQNEFQRLRSLSSANFPSVYVSRYYDANMSDIGISLTSAAIYRLDIAIVTPTAPAPADRIFNAEVHYPANAAAANQNVARFTALINVPP